MKKFKKFTLLFFIGFAIWFLIPPEDLFDEPLSTVVEDENGKLLGCRIAEDDQWRFPLIDTLPNTFIECMTTYEDERFFQHPGVDPIAIVRAMGQNIRSKKIVSGASTLTMQLMRMSRAKSKRSLKQKIIESLLALKYDFHYSKDYILKLYATHAPFGGNVVGLETAAWRYYSTSPENLSYAQMASLVVLPNNPSMVHPDRNRQTLLNKRNFVLKKLFDNGVLNEMDYKLAVEEDLMTRTYPLPNHAPHLVEFHDRMGNDNNPRIKSTLDFSLQKKVNSIIDFHHSLNEQKEVHNAAAIVLENKTGKIKAYVGNAPNSKQEVFNDMIVCARSSGSILKPILYALAIDKALITPDQLINDLPIDYNGFAPRNYNKQFSGVVQASNALSQSLNIPFVNLLQQYGVHHFLNELSQMGFETISKTPEHYGLSLILGGAEVNLLNLAEAYSSLTYIHDHYIDHDSKLPTHIPVVSYLQDESIKTNHIKITPGSIHHMLKAMEKLSRPDQEGGWEIFNSAQNISWKTGTSFGNKDAWSVGLNKNYTVAVWVGNSSGVGRPDIIGADLAGSILFDVFHQLGGAAPFEKPFDDLIEKTICSKSGMIAGPHCPESTLGWLPHSSKRTKPCNFHQKIFVDNRDGKRVNLSCSDMTEMIDTSWFVLNAAQSHYYKRHNHDFEPLPNFKQGCDGSESTESISILDLAHDSKIYLPVNNDGEKEKLIIQASHIYDQDTIYWHVNGDFLKSTFDDHSVALDLNVGRNKIKIVDNDGNTSTTVFEILN